MKKHPGRHKGIFCYVPEKIFHLDSIRYIASIFVTAVQEKNEKFGKIGKKMIRGLQFVPQEKLK